MTERFSLSSVASTAPPEEPWAQTPPLDILDALASPPPDFDFVFPGLETESVGAIVGEGGVGKSMIVLQLAASISSGFDVLGLGVPAVGKVVYLTAEDPKKVIARRLHSLRDTMIQRGAREVDIRRMAANLRILPLLGRSPDLSAPAAGLDDLITGTRLVIIDTLSRFHSQDESNPAEMAALIGRMERLIKTAKEDPRGGGQAPAFMYVHHVNKASARDGSAGEQTASRGSTVLVNHSRFQMNLTVMSKGEAIDTGCPDDERYGWVKLSFPKISYDRRIDDKWFRKGDGGMLMPDDPHQSYDAPAKVAPRAAKRELRAVDADRYERESNGGVATARGFMGGAWAS